MITVAVCTVAMDVETTLKGAFVETGEKAWIRSLEKRTLKANLLPFLHFGQWMLRAENLPETLQPEMHQVRLLVAII